MATKRAIGRDHGPVTLVGHSCGRTEITEAGVYDKVRSLVYPAPSPTILERATRTWQMVTLASGVTITDRKMAREVTDWFADTENALLFNDSRRVYYFLQTERSTFDSELLYVSAVAHNMVSLRNTAAL